MSKCCERPYTVMDIETQIYSCRFCGSKYKLCTSLIYDCCNLTVTDVVSDSRKDDKTNWCLCNRETHYREKQSIMYL